MLAFNTVMASVGYDFCSDVGTVSQTLLLAMLQVDQQHLRTMLKNYSQEKITDSHFLIF